MTRLDELLLPLRHGVWEVEIPKDSVTEPLDAGWEISRINVPSPGTIASYRKGQYHAHETATEWRVHLDNHDPTHHPYLHLIDDAPLLLMIGDTFGTIIAGTRERTGDETRILEGQVRSWRDQVLIGLFIIFTGIFIITNPVLIFRGIALLFIPLVIIGLGLFTIMKSMAFQPFRISEDAALYRGIIITFAGIIAFYLPLSVWIIGLLAILAAWMSASAVVLLARARKGRSAIPEGFISRVVIALLSLCLVGLIFIYPVETVALLMIVLGFIALLLGIMLFVNGVRLKRRMERTLVVPDIPENEPH